MNIAESKNIDFVSNIRPAFLNDEGQMSNVYLRNTIHFNDYQSTE